jgi:ABC-2 type transport system permease protein
LRSEPGAGPVGAAGRGEQPLLAAGRVVLPGDGFTAAHGFTALSLADDLTRRAAIGTALYIGLIAFLGAGLGLLLRDTAGALTTALALLYGSPIVATFVNDPKWQHRIHRFSPMDAGLAIQSTRNLAAEHIGPWAGIGILSQSWGSRKAARALPVELLDQCTTRPCHPLGSTAVRTLTP